MLPFSYASSLVCAVVAVERCTQRDASTHADMHINLAISPFVGLSLVTFPGKGDTTGERRFDVLSRIN